MKLRIALFIIYLLSVFCITNAQALNINKLIVKQRVAIQKTQKSFMKKANAPGMSVSVMFSNRSRVYTIDTGNKAFHSEKKLTPSTLFQVGSITKTFISTIMLKLQSEGKLKLSDTIGHWLPKYKRWKNITLKELLNMTSGIPGYFGTSAFNKAWQKAPFRTWTPQEIISRFAYNKPLLFKPAQGWEYSDTNYLLLGLIIEKATEHSVKSELQQKIFTPLNLKNTYYFPKAYSKKILRKLASGYDNNNKDVTNVNMSQAGAAGAVVSTTVDIAKFYHAIFEDNFLTKSEFSQLTSLVSKKTGQPISAENKASGFGLGINHTWTPEGPLWFKAGGTIGYMAMATYAPYKHTVMTYAVNKATDYPNFMGSLTRDLYKALFPVTTIDCHKLQNTLKHMRDKFHIGGMGLYVKSPKLTTGSCYVFSGSVKHGSKRKISHHNLWQIGSITKSYFSAVLLQLEAESESGKIAVKFNINQKLKQWFPEYPDWGNITIKQLLNMTGGIYNYTELPGFTKKILSHPKKVWTAKEVVNLAYQHKPNIYFSPGKGWHYSNTDYMLAGLLIQKIYHKAKLPVPSQQAILREQLLNKINLNNTYYYLGALPNRILKRMVHGYGYYNKKDMTSINLSVAGPSGAMIANPKQVADWIKRLFTQDMILPRKQLKEMKSLVSQKTGMPVTISDTETIPAYGLGLTEQYSKKLGAVWLYSGLTFGYTATYIYVPKYHTIISYTANTGSATKIPSYVGFMIRTFLKTVFAS